MKLNHIYLSKDEENTQLVMWWPIRNIKDWIIAGLGGSIKGDFLPEILVSNPELQRNAVVRYFKQHPDLLTIQKTFFKRNGVVKPPLEENLKLDFDLGCGQDVISCFSFKPLFESKFISVDKARETLFLSEASFEFQVASKRIEGQIHSNPLQEKYVWL